MTNAFRVADTSERDEVRRCRTDNQQFACDGDDRNGFSGPDIPGTEDSHERCTGGCAKTSAHDAASDGDDDHHERQHNGQCGKHAEDAIPKVHVSTDDSDED